MKIRTGFVSNSSSEAFICDTKKSLHEIEGELRFLLALYNKMKNENRSFEDTFRVPEKATKSNVDYLNNWLDCYKEAGEALNATVEGKIIIYSASDNTIPWSLFEIIEDAYEAQRIHLG